MPERSSKRKARRDSVSSSIGEPETSSLRTENIPSISDNDFSELSEKIEKSVSRRIKDAEVGQREILRMIENLSSKMIPCQTNPLRTQIIIRSIWIRPNLVHPHKEKIFTSCPKVRVNTVTHCILVGDVPLGRKYDHGKFWEKRGC